MKVWLLLAGDGGRAGWTVDEEDIVIAVDGGMKHAVELGIVPSVWIGDFDSADPVLLERYSRVAREKHPVDKDATDFELAMMIVQRDYPQAKVLSIIGGVGGELDHAFGNMWILPHFGFSAIMWGMAQHIVYMRAGRLRCRACVNDTVSIYALTPLLGMRYQGLRWCAPVDGLQPFSALASRNITDEEQIEISWQEGDGIIVIDSSASSFDLQQ